MQYLTLEKESGAIQAVNMGLIGEEVEYLDPFVEGDPIWRKGKLFGIAVIDEYSAEEGKCSQGQFFIDDGERFESIRIPKPTIEDLRVGDIVLMDRKNPFRQNHSLPFSMSIDHKNRLIDLKGLIAAGEVKNLKLITRKSEGVDVLD